MTITSFRNHFSAIALFYVIALTLRIITLIIGNKYPTHEENYLFQLSTGLGPMESYPARDLVAIRLQYTGQDKGKAKIRILEW